MKLVTNITRLHDFLQPFPPNANIKLYNEGGDLLYWGEVKDITETIMFTNWDVVAHHQEDSALLIWIV